MTKRIEKAYRPVDSSDDWDMAVCVGAMPIHRNSLFQYKIEDGYFRIYSEEWQFIPDKETKEVLLAQAVKLGLCEEFVDQLEEFCYTSLHPDSDQHLFPGKLELAQALQWETQADKLMFYKLATRRILQEVWE